SSGAQIRLASLPKLFAHEAQLVQLFQNLISNSIKYRSEQQPSIQISAILEGSEWRFVVSDNGIGIDQKYHAQVFEPFRRLHSAAEYDGCGLGLATCKGIVEQHAGCIWVESECGEGSLFYFT